MKSKAKCVVVAAVLILGLRTEYSLSRADTDSASSRTVFSSPSLDVYLQLSESNQIKRISEYPS